MPFGGERELVISFVATGFQLEWCCFGLVRSFWDKLYDTRKSNGARKTSAKPPLYNGDTQHVESLADSSTNTWCIHRLCAFGGDRRLGGETRGLGTYYLLLWTKQTDGLLPGATSYA